MMTSSAGTWVSTTDPTIMIPTEDTLLICYKNQRNHKAKITFAYLLPSDDDPPVWIDELVNAVIKPEKVSHWCRVTVPPGA